MLPRRYKKNLRNLFVIHPRFGLRVFIEFARIFLSKKFFSKLHLVDNIASMQMVLSHNKLRMPPEFISAEDEENGLKYTKGGISPPLTSIYDPTLGAPKLLVLTTAYLTRYGLQQEGLFRVPGNNLLSSLVKARLQRGLEAIDSIIIGSSTSSTQLNSSAEPQGTSEVGFIGSGNERTSSAMSSVTSSVSVESVGAVAHEERVQLGYSRVSLRFNSDGVLENMPESRIEDGTRCGSFATVCTGGGTAAAAAAAAATTTAAVTVQADGKYQNHSENTDGAEFILPTHSTNRVSRVHIDDVPTVATVLKSLFDLPVRNILS